MQNKFTYFIFILLIFFLLIPYFSYATDATSYVWSENSSPIVTTSSVLSEGKR